MKKILALLLIATSVVSAQQKTPTVITMEQAINLALDKNTDLKIASMEVKKSEKKLWEAYSGLFPQITATGQYQRYIELPVLFLPPGSPFGTVLKIGYDNSYVASASLSMPIFSWTLYKGIGVASDAVTISKQSYSSTKNKVITDVKKAFLAAILTRETKDVMVQSLKNAEDNLENVKRLKEGGTLSDYDVLRAEVQVENLRPVVLQMENNYKLSLEALKVTIGLDASEEIEVAGEIDFEGPYQVPSEEAVINELMKNNPQLAILHTQVQLTNKNIALERSAYLPTLVGIGSYQYQAQANDFKFNDYKWVSTSLVGVQLQIPIFKGGKTNARVSQAQIGYNQALEQERNATEALKTQALSIVYKIEQAVKRIEGQEKTVQQAEQGYEIAKRRFTNGLATQLEVNDAELALRQARLNKVQAIYDLKVAESELETVLGKNN
ncbi:MAG: TolC family protein [Bacteroidetes bacterium]|nr:TolC family protein [Bacteroidota bacterium]